MSRDFRNERGFSSAVLRPNVDETPDEALERLREAGWIIDDYEMSEDENGQTVFRPKSSPGIGLPTENDDKEES